VLTGARRTTPGRADREALAYRRRSPAIRALSDLCGAPRSSPAMHPTQASASRCTSSARPMPGVVIAAGWMHTARLCRDVYSRLVGLEIGRHRRASSCRSKPPGSPSCAADRDARQNRFVAPLQPLRRARRQMWLDTCSSRGTVFLFTRLSRSNPALAALAHLYGWAREAEFTLSAWPDDAMASRSTSRHRIPDRPRRRPGQTGGRALDAERDPDYTRRILLPHHPHLCGRAHGHL